MFGWVESVRSFFFGPKSLEKIEEELLNQLINANSKYSENIQGIFKHTIETGFGDIKNDLPPNDNVVGMLEALPWINQSYPEIFEAAGYYENMTGDLHRLFGWGRLIRIPGIAYNPSAMGWITRQDKFIKSVNSEENTLETENSQQFVRYLIKNAKNGIQETN
tara:strand:+ start:192 stop:680 length:489 start_codon:yes stop_codon:yes gene_type:complete